MIHVIDCENREAYRSELADLHRARKRVFVDELGWRLRVEDGGEWDEYDDERAMFAVGFDADGRVTMNGRFRPTDDGHVMLLDHFQHALWSDVGPVAGPRTWEISRCFSLEPGNRRSALRRQAACMLAPLEIAFRAGVDRYVGFSDLTIVPFVSSMGWRVTLLGDPVSYGEGVGVAFQVEVSAPAIAALRAQWALPDPAHIHLATAALAGERPLDHAERLARANPAYATLAPLARNRPSQSPSWRGGRSNRPEITKLWQSPSIAAR